jgi:hypothetical protein
MKYPFVIIISLYICSSIFAQRIYPERPYEPIEFEDLKPIWYQTYFDSTATSLDTMDGYNIMINPTDIPDLIEGDYIYSAVYLRNLYEKTGTYISKRNLNTGELIWITRYGLPDGPRQELMRLMYFNKEGKLEVFSQLKPNPLGTDPVWVIGYNYMKHTKRIYEPDTGELLYYDHPDYDEEGFFLTTFYYFGRSTSFFREGDSIRCIKLFKQDSTKNYSVDYMSTLMDYKSKNENLLIDTLIMTHTACAGYAFKANNPFRFTENEYLFLEANTKDKRLLFRYTDKNMHVQEEFYTDSIGEKANEAYLYQVSADHQKFLVVNTVRPDFFSKYLEILVFDRQANLLQKTTLPEGYSNGAFDVLEWDEENQSIKMIASKLNYSTPKTVRTSLDILYLDKFGELTIAKKMYFTDSLRFILSPVSRKIGKDKYLLKFIESSMYIDESEYAQADHAAKAYSYMLVDQSYFDITLNSNEIENPKVKIYPNPSSGKLILEIENYNNSYIFNIFNLQGQAIFSKPIDSYRRFETDLGYLPSGIYPFTISNNNEVIFEGKWIKTN